MKDDRRILLSTIHASDNYGSVLQAWCLTEALGGFGAVEVLDHRPLRINAGYAQDWLPYQLLRRRANPQALRFVRKHLRARAAQRALLPLSQRVRRRPQAAHYDGYDTVVVGSDEVWSDLWGDVPHFFLADVPDGTRRVAYGVSAGRSRRLGQSPEVPRWIGRFDAVLPRDTNTATLCADAGTPAGPVVCDPVLLADPERLRWQARPPAPGAPYALVYHETCRADARVADALAVLGGPPRLVSVGFPHPGAEPAIDADLAGFVGLVDGAGVVVTSMYHGIVTSLALGRLVVALTHPAKSLKVDDLLRRTGATTVAEGEGWVAVSAGDDLDRFRAASRRALVDAMG